MKRPNHASAAAEKPHKWKALRLAGIYALIASIWILVSDRLVSNQILDTAFGEWSQTVKGLAFVLVTAGLLFLLLTYWLPPTQPIKQDHKPLNRGLILTLAGIVGFIPLIAGLIVFMQTPVLENKAHDHLQILVQNKAHQLNRWYQERQADAQVLQNDKRFDAHLNRFLSQTNPSEQSSALIRQRLQDLYRFYHYEGVVLLDRNFQTQMAFGRTNQSSIDDLPELKRVLNKAAASGQIQTTPFYFEPKTNHTHLDWVIPIQSLANGASHNQGFILIHAGPKQFIYPLFAQKEHRPHPMQLALMHRSDDKDYSPLFPERNDARNFLHHPCLVKALQPALQAMSATTLQPSFCDGERGLVALQPFDSADWILVAGVKREFLVQKLYEIVIWVALISLIIMSALGYAIWLLWRQQERVYQLQLAVSSNRLNHFLSISPTVLYVFTGAPDNLQAEYISPNAESLLGEAPDPDNLIEWWKNRLHPEDRIEVTQCFLDVLTRTDDHKDHVQEYRFWHPDHSYMNIRDQFRVFHLPNGQIEIVGSLQDMTLEVEQKNRLEQAQIVYDATQEGIVITDDKQRIINVNAAFERITGYTLEEIKGQTPAFLKSGEHAKAFYDRLWHQLTTKGYWQGEIWDRRKNGERYPELLGITQVRNKQDDVRYYVGVFSDISSMKNSEAALDYLSHHDALTGLANRTLLTDQLDGLLARHKTEHKHLAVLLLDLDRFKYVNESFGHDIGDELLQTVTKRLKRELHKEQLLARFGADEFVVVMPDLKHQEDAARLAEALIQSISESFQLADHTEITTSASIGISLYPFHGKTAQALLQNADAAMHKIKGDQHNERYTYYTRELTDLAQHRIGLETRLKQALKNDELEMMYQPQIALDTGKIIGAEALLRWQDPERGTIAPDQFIGLAEETGLIIDIGDWVLKNVCRQGRQWLDQGLDIGRLAINLSSRQFQDANVVKTIEVTLAQTLLPPHVLEIEITESSLMRSQERASRRLAQLQAMGISIAMDDFGTGYSSLAYLRNLPLDILKIDKTFIDGIGQNLQTEQIIDAIIAMGHSLDMKVLAEGVETLEQRDFLAEHGADFYQGYYFARPLSAEAFADLLRR
ncbi:putative bifunctional diguanylate cyclase/phosphodiesterase [Hydrogenovibrio halophilus]|uniref:putative bifunctional diguanylate cyclase/phosphodiesterase n=1 Tax=Hydrogenovibrio halophilus TaxID=373391 RepID=UPI0003680BEB|nr:GGDEF domain-containing phosphodiesterase [Hydrogenovibrio halophilus]